VSVQQFAAHLNKVAGVTNVTINDETKTAAVAYTGEMRGVLDIQAAVGTQGAVIDPSYVGASITASPDGFCIHDLNDALKPVQGIRQFNSAKGGFEFWANLDALNVDRLFTQPFKFTVLTHDFFELKSASQVEPEQWEKLRAVLLETKSVLRASLSATGGLQVISIKGKLTPDGLRNLAERSELTVKVKAKK
jgi:copper chaperone CopZ